MFFTLISANICVTIIIIECSFELVVFAVASLLQYSVPGALPSNRTILVYYFSTIQRPRPLRAPSPPPPHSKASNGSSNGLELRKESTSAVVLWCAMVWSAMHSTTGCCLAIIDLNVLALFFLSFAPHLAIEITTYFALECVCM